MTLYTAADRDACAALYFDLFTHDPWGYDWMTLENVCRYFTDLENTPCFLGATYAHGGRLAGFCLGVISDYFLSASFEIKEIAVARDMQGAGIGGRLLRGVEDYLAARGVQTVTLATRREMDAFSFYVRHGYEVSDGAVYMSKFLCR